MARIEELPTEVLVHILNNLDLADIVENCSEKHVKDCDSYRRNFSCNQNLSD